MIATLSSLCLGATCMGMSMFTMAWIGRPDWAGYALARALGQSGRWSQMDAVEQARFVGGARRLRIPLLLSLFILCYAGGAAMTLVRLS